jgi:hypothetical protein
MTNYEMALNKRERSGLSRKVTWETGIKCPRLQKREGLHEKRRITDRKRSIAAMSRITPTFF